MLATLLKPDAGQARICGYDVVTEAVQVRQLIALTGQYASVDDELTGTENLIMICRLLGFGRAAARRPRGARCWSGSSWPTPPGRAVKTYSGGMRRRLDLAASLLGEPEVLFLDEPTTGLDPRGRGQMWDTIRGVIAGGATVLLTTQYLEEADELADQIAVIDHGLVVASGTPAELKARTGSQTLAVRAMDRRTPRRWPRSWPRSSGRGRTSPTPAWSPPRSPTRRWFRPSSGGSTTPASWPPSWRCGCPAWTRCS